jgi:integrase
LPAARCKNGRSHVIPLAPLALTIIGNQRRPEPSPSGPSLAGPHHDGVALPTVAAGLFARVPEPDSATRDREQISAEASAPSWPKCGRVFERCGFSKQKEKLDSLLPGLEPWTLHDLRRTAASGMAGLGVQPHVIEATLNHRSGAIRGVAAVYNRYNYAGERRVALVAWSKHVDSITAPEMEIAA